MKIAAINSGYLNISCRGNNKNLAQGINKKITSASCKTTELSPLEKFADILLDKNVKEIPQELNSARKEFDALSKHEQDKLLLSAKSRK